MDGFAMVSGRRRVVVTGMGCITPLGTRVDELWTHLKNGDSGVGLTTVFDASKFPTKISAEVRNWDITDEGYTAEDWKYCGRHTKFAAGAAMRAMIDAGLSNGLDDPTRLGVYLGSGEGLKYFETGRAQFYALIVFGGVIALVVLFGVLG